MAGISPVACNTDRLAAATTRAPAETAVTAAAAGRNKLAGRLAADPHDPAVVRQTAAGLVSQLFFAPLLAEMRKLPFGKQLTDGGRTEAVFGEQLDTRLADTIAAADGGGLTTKVAAQIRRTQAVGGTAAQGALKESQA
jgi:hypothetical protein